MTRVLSDHTSNPLQANTSDPLNRKYNREYTQAIFPSSEDELGTWTGQRSYHEHIEMLVAQRPQDIVTPKSLSLSARRMRDVRFMDLDEERSDDELVQYGDEDLDRTVVDPRKEFKMEEDVQEEEDVQKEEDVQEEEEEGDDDEKEGRINFVDLDEAEEEDADDADELDGIPRAEVDSDDDDLADYHAPNDSDDDDDAMLIASSPSLSPSSPFSSPQSSRPPSPDESKTLLARPEDEQVQIQDEMAELYKAVPGLEDKYELLDRLGTGTFSSVYKAVDLLYDEWDNKPWLGHHPPDSSAFYQSAGPAYKGRGGRAAKWRQAASSCLDINLDTDADVNMDGEDERDELHALPKDGKVYVALKRIYTTSGPERIRNELSILETVRGCRHTSQIITAFRHMDQVVIVLPYQRNQDFREFYPNLHPEGFKCYLRCLFRALRDIHARGIIHRDVKPANFLYDPFTGIGTLCDFGLASRMEPGETMGRCLHSPWSEAHPHGKNHSLDEEKTMMVHQAQMDAKIKSGRRPEKVGYPLKDTRPTSKANRAGTRGFRAPEVLLKCGAQTGAIDVWSVGVILLCYLTGKFPIFQSNDDIEALMEIAVILGKKKMVRSATLHGRKFATNVPDIDEKGITWTEFAQRLNPEIMTPRKYDMRYYPHNMKHRDGHVSSTPTNTMDPPPVPSRRRSDSPPSASTSHPPASKESTTTTTTKADSNPNPISDRYLNPPSLERHTKDMRSALDLLEQALHIESTKRLTPRSALYHPFLSEPSIASDDAFFPHPPYRGVCKELHFENYDESNSHTWECGEPDAEPEMCVAVWVQLDLEVGLSVDLSRVLGRETMVDEEGVRWVKDRIVCMPGQGIAIGNRPCEFHRGELYGFE